MFQSRSRHNEFETETKLRDELSLWVSRIGRRQMMTWCTQISEENLGSYTISASELEENFVHWNLSVVACLATVRKKHWTEQAVPSGSYNRFRLLLYDSLAVRYSLVHASAAEVKG